MPTKHRYHTVTHLVHTTCYYAIPCADTGINMLQVDKSVVQSNAISQLCSSVHEHHHQINALLTHIAEKIT